MIEQLLPVGVSVVEAWEDGTDIRLFPEEEQTIARAVEKRRREFATGRACARAALARLGFAPAPILTGERGEPCWPEGVVGSITHCDGYRAGAVGRSSELLTLGIDAEPNAPLPAGLLGDIARPEELPWLRALQERLPGVHWDRLLFSAKEAVYKAWFPLARRWLGFEDAVLSVDPRAGTFTARLLVPGPALGGAPLRGFDGRWVACDGIIATAIALSAR
jgi:enterobactin synthetase component D / holo-[acyl-carrier protein] synthase